MLSVKDCMEALKDTSKFSNFTGKGFLVKLFQGHSASVRGHLVKHRPSCLDSTVFVMVDPLENSCWNFIQMCVKRENLPDSGA